MHSVSRRRAGCRKSCGSNRRCKGKTPYAAAYYRYSALRIPLPHPCLHPGYSLAWDRCDELRQSTAFVSRNSRTFSAYASFPLRGRIRSVWPSSVHCWSAGAAGSGSLTRRRHSRTLVRGHEGEPNNGKDPANGSTVEASGRGFFMGEYSGLEIAIKDSKRFKDEPGNWAYFTWGHKPFPYDKTASKFPAESCNACHAANADDDWVFTQFYPVLRAAKSVEVGSDQANAS